MSSSGGNRGGSIAAVLATATGDGSGSVSTSSTTFANIHSSLNIAGIAAAVGDRLEVELDATIDTSDGTANAPHFQFLVGANSTVVGSWIPNAQTANLTIHLRAFVTVTAGMISSGQVSVTPQYRVTSSGTLTVYNTSTAPARIANASVKNWLH